MKIILDWDSVKAEGKKRAISVGNFDGVHLGHQAILKRLKEAVLPDGESVVITFSNHPAEILRPEEKPLLLCSLQHRLKIIEELGIDTVAVLTFTKEFSQQTADKFLLDIASRLPFTHLILGPDARMGKDRTGDKKLLLELAKKLQFHLEFLEKYTINDQRVSSTHIRAFVRQGNLIEASKMLGRDFSVYQPVKSGQGIGKKIGFPTINCAVDGLCLPPLGVYAVRIRYEGRLIDGVANLGMAPTVRQDAKTILEAHLFDDSINILDGTWVEIILIQYIRPEHRFNSLEELKMQIDNDTQTAQTILKLKKTKSTSRMYNPFFI